MNKDDYFKTKFPDNRAKGKTVLKKIQIVQLRLLRIFDYICKKYKLNYFLIGGTLLGAIRHKGFIPWDDDTDIIMPREDYEKLSKVIKKELPSDLFWQDTDTDNFPHFRTLIAKIRNNNSQMEKNDNYHTGIYLDIFIMEKISTDSKIGNHQKKYLNFLFQLDLLRNSKAVLQEVRTKKIMAKGSLIKFFVKLSSKIIEFFLRVVDVPGILRKAYYKKINKQKHMYFWYTGGRYLDFQKKDVFPLKKVPFEGFKFNSLQNHHKFLTDFFGDYMTLPPKHMRKPDHIILEETKI